MGGWTDTELEEFAGEPGLELNANASGQNYAVGSR